jgi:hypothetical protein
MTNKPWKAEYWPMLIEELIKDNKKEKDNQHNFPNIYDYSGRINVTLGLKPPKKDANNRYAHRYLYISTPEIMQKILDNWDNLTEQHTNIKRRMKHIESKYLARIIYRKRKEEFDALVAETNS